MATKITIMDIARQVGYSKSTVSRVLMHDPNVKSETREIIQKAIEENHFRCNEVARGMVTGNLRIVMIIAGDISNYFYSVAVKEIEKKLYNKGYLVVVSTSEYDAQKELSYLGMAGKFRMAAVILMTAIESEELIGLIREVDCPVLLMNRYLAGYELDAVVQDNFQCAYIATKHLIEMGHRRIMHITSGRGANTSIDRRAGFIAAMNDAGFEVTPDMQVYGDLTWESGYTHAKRIIEQKLDFSAVFIGNDMMTVGFVEAWTERGKSIPEDISLICFDKSPFLDQLPVRISTVGHRANDLGIKTAELLLERLSNPDMPPRRIVLQPSAQFRESVKNIKSLP